MSVARMSFLLVPTDHICHRTCLEWHWTQCSHVANTGLSKRDFYVLRPTGGSKSRCYQSPDIMTGRVTLVTAPLVSLLNDQLLHLAEAGTPVPSDT
jgi:superfamily II DNA helicase RecQ